MAFFDWMRKGTPGRSAGNGTPGAASAAASQFAPSQFAPSTQAGTAHAQRKNLLRMVLRDTLAQNGIPSHWLDADLLRSTAQGREQGIHVRLLIRHWDPRLLEYGVAFEQNFHQRLTTMDPLAADWLMGISWQFAMDDTSACPPLPNPGSWTRQQPGAAPAARNDAARTAESAPAGRPARREPAPAAAPEAVKGELERMLAGRDEAHRRQAQGPGFAQTQPVSIV